MARRGLTRVGCCPRFLRGTDWPDSQHDFAFSFLGLVGLADPLRASVPDAVSECRSAGITVVMITGDYPSTARAIARQAGLDAEDLVTGEELDQLSEAALALRVRTATVFARIMPEQKLRIVNALKANGEIVAMTGDGVNDAPIAQGSAYRYCHGRTRDGRGARGVVYRIARRRFRIDRQVSPAGPPNLRQPPQGDGLHFRRARADRWTGTAAAAVWIADPVWAHAHRFFGNGDRSGVFARLRGGDGGRRCNASAAAAPDEPLFSGPLIGWSLLQGAFAFVLVAVIFIVAFRRGMPEEEVRALAFFSLILTIVSLIFVNRSFSASLVTAFRRPNPALALVLLAVTTMLGLTLLWPFASGSLPFRTSALGRSRVDAWRRRSCAGCPRGFEAPVTCPLLALT